MLESGENKNFEEVPVTNHPFRRHHHHGKNNKVVIRDVPKGFLPIKVGQGEEQQKILMPVMYLNHPLFSQLLKEAEEEYGFDQQGTIIIPCHLEEFRYIQDLINKDKYPQHHHHHVTSCFKPSR
ncbi:hypothetical protein RJT34_15708 [Clitoria ternatea]|uniref:Uncharacterized protein n=1 Tax=Clitoria ternatea TaxID=43366 RepID=A0AAN9J8W7_CLITE